jgi:hypothetical protein
MTLHDDVGGNSKIDKDELKSKRLQIEPLMKVEKLEEGITDDYRYAIKVLPQKREYSLL